MVRIRNRKNRCKGKTIKLQTGNSSRSPGGQAGPSSSSPGLGPSSSPAPPLVILPIILRIGESVETILFWFVTWSIRTVWCDWFAPMENSRSWYSLPHPWEKGKCYSHKVYSRPWKLYFYTTVPFINFPPCLLTRDRPDRGILVPDWLITIHVT